MPEGCVSPTKGDLFIVASPSGGGKTTIIRRVMAGMTEQGWQSFFSVSHTTRAPRDGERHGVDYYFVDRPAFREMIDRGEFLEWAEYVGNLYGTSHAAVEAQRVAGCDVFLDIEVQGARQVRERVPDAVGVFILPPTLEVLRQRLVARGKDAPATIERRIRIATMEMAEYPRFDYVMINDRLDEAVQALGAIVHAARLRTRRRAPLAQRILESFQSALVEA
jgi:guanylate kinase